MQTAVCLSELRGESYTEPGDSSSWLEHTLCYLGALGSNPNTTGMVLVEQGCGVDSPLLPSHHPPRVLGRG